MYTTNCRIKLREEDERIWTLDPARATRSVLVAMLEYPESDSWYVRPSEDKSRGKTDILGLELRVAIQSPFDAS